MTDVIHPFWGGPKQNKESVRGIIRNWYKVYYGSNYVVCGTLLAPSDRRVMSQFFRTSLVLHMNQDETELETLNSLYRLEKKRAETTT